MSVLTFHARNSLKECFFYISSSVVYLGTIYRMCLSLCCSPHVHVYIYMYTP